MHNLLQGGFSGPIMPVNPRYKAVSGVLAYPSVQSLPVIPDLAIVCTPPKTVPGFVQALGRQKTRAAIIMSTDLESMHDEQGRSLRQAMLDYARQYSLRILGPDCLGLIIPGAGLNASFAHTRVLSGQIAFVSQSDALCTAVLDWAHSRGIGFSHFISLGDSGDIDFGDVIDYLGGEPFTKSILLYIENVKNARNFMSAARSASRNKPLLVIKSGRMEESAQAVASHTGVLTSSDDVYGAAFRRAGMLRVYEVDALFDAVETLARFQPLKGDRLAILSNGGGPGIMATDALISSGGQLAELSEKSKNELQNILEGKWSGENPVRIMDHAPGEMYADSLSVLKKDKNVDAVLVMHVPSAFTSGEDIAGAVVNVGGGRKCNVLTSWLGQEAATKARRIFSLAGLPTYATPDKAVRAFMDMVRYRRNQEMLMETPDSAPQEFTPDVAAARAVVRKALEDERNMLSGPEAKEILSLYGIPIVATRIAEDVEEAELLANELGYPVALKISSPDIVHKLDVGGVILDLESPEELVRAARSMLYRIEKLQPGAQVEGFIVQKMARRPGAHELIVGTSTDPIFGPVILFGQGGAAVEIIKDRAVGLPPLNMTLARELIQRTRIAKLLYGFREQPGVDLDAVKLTLMQVSQLIIDIPEIAELDINPLLADSSGVLVLDAHIVVSPTTGSGHERLAIRPYPRELEECTQIRSGERVLLRPIRPEDEPDHLEFVNNLSQEDIRMRFFGPVRDFPHTQMARFTQIDYDREMAFIAKLLTEQGQGKTLGVVRTFFDPDNVHAEVAIVVRSDLKLQGLGSVLMEKMLRYCRKRGTKELTAHTLRENKGMIALGKKFGFQVLSMEDDEDMIQLKLDFSQE
jgi:acetyltransferase